ncbi:hypothetical protein [Lysinibacillus sp. TE18511]
MNDIKIPKLNPPTDLEKNSFIEENYQLIIEELEDILITIQNQNSNFIYQKQNINNCKIVYGLYLNGKNLNNLKVWLGNFFSPIKQIQFSIGRYVEVNNDNSMNGSVNVEVDLDYNLSLGMPMNMFSSNKKNMNYKEVVKEIYEHHILPYLNKSAYKHIILVLSYSNMIENSSCNKNVIFAQIINKSRKVEISTYAINITT